MAVLDSASWLELIQDPDRETRLRSGTFFSCDLTTLYLSLPNADGHTPASKQLVVDALSSSLLLPLEVLMPGPEMDEVSLFQAVACMQRLVTSELLRQEPIDATTLERIAVSCPLLSELSFTCITVKAADVLVASYRHRHTINMRVPTSNRVILSASLLDAWCRVVEQCTSLRTVCVHDTQPH